MNDQVAEMPGSGIAMARLCDSLPNLARRRGLPCPPDQLDRSLARCGCGPSASHLAVEGSLELLRSWAGRTPLRPPRRSLQAKEKEGRDAEFLGRIPAPGKPRPGSSITRPPQESTGD